jgi:hypothetical protein
MPDCANHRDNLSECPQEHVCRCGKRLSDHHGTGAACPSGGAFYPNAETLARFPEQYRRD